MSHPIIRLYLNYFAHSDAARADEMRTCLLRNTENTHFNEIVILAQSCRPPWLDGISKIVWIDVTEMKELSYGRPNFQLFFDIANSRLKSPYDFSIISNSDIWFDETIGKLGVVSLENICLAISRHEDNGSGELAWDNSQDTWVFQGPIRRLLYAGFPMGLFCCDWRLAWELTHAGYRVLNPAFSIRCWHLHNSPVRNVISARIGGPHQSSTTRQRIEDCYLPPAQPHREGIIGMSLWGTGERYLTGAVRNAESVRQIYPGWTLRVYHDETISSDLLKKLADLQVELVLRERSNGSSGMFWRFEVADDPGYEYWCVRDIDARFSYRERRAVDDWIESGKSFHIMVDHPWHTKPIMGGAFGGRRGVINMGELAKDWHERTRYGDDERFLADKVFPLIRDQACLHHWDQRLGNPFPVPRERGQFMLGTVFHDEYFEHAAWRSVQDEEAKAKYAI